MIQSTSSGWIWEWPPPDKQGSVKVVDEVQLWRRLGVMVDTSWERAVAELEFVMVASPLYHAIAKLSRILGVRASLS